MIYFLKSPRGPIKIGTTNRLAHRLRQLNTSHFEKLEVLAVADGSRGAEKYLHSRFAYLRRAGEWFDAGEELMALIASDCRPWDGLDDPRPQALGPWPIEVETTLAARIRAERLRLGLTQEEMAARLGSKRVTYKQLEASANPQVSTLLGLVLKGGMDPRHLLPELFSD